MFDFSWGRRFGLSKGAVACDKDGLFVGSVPLLQRELWFGFLMRWAARPAADIERDLGFCYGLPIDVRGKAGGLAAVANALNRDDLFAASVAALHLEFPDPPRFAKGAWPEGALLKLAGELWRSGLLKDWNSDEHPRTGTKPNPGWFANKPPEEPRELTITRGPSRSRWPSKLVNKRIREWAKEFGDKLARGARTAEGAAEEVGEGAKALAERAGPVALEATEDFAIGAAEDLAVAGAIVVGPEAAPVVASAIILEAGIAEVMTEFEAAEFNAAEERAIAQMKTNFDPPKTLEELQTPPTENELGYEQHHIVEQNPSNVEKGEFEKFGRGAIDDPDNLVSVPRLKHEQITSDYNRIDNNDPLRRTLRNVVKGMDFDEQRAVGLAILQKFGVLK